MFRGLMVEPWRQAAVPESWCSLFPPVKVFSQLCLAVAWEFLLLPRSLPTAVVQGGAPLAASGWRQNKNQRKVVVAARSLWLPCFPASYIAVLCSLSLRGLGRQ